MKRVYYYMISAVHKVQRAVRALVIRFGLKSCGANLKVFGRCKVDMLRYVSFGDNVHLNENVVISAKRSEIIVGNNVIFSAGCVVTSIGYNFDGRSKNSHSDAPITIEDNAWIGANATILPGVRVGKCAVIAAGAVVSKDVEVGTIVGGVPAKLIRKIER